MDLPTKYAYRSPSCELYFAKDINANVFVDRAAAAGPDATVVSGSSAITTGGGTAAGSTSSGAGTSADVALKFFRDRGNYDREKVGR